MNNVIPSFLISSWNSVSFASKRLFSIVFSGISYGSSWFFANKIEESKPHGELMRQAMLPSSWFDRISAQWVAQPLVIPLAMSAVSCLLGFLVGTPALFLAITIGLSLVVHKALVSHHTKRIAQAQKIMCDTLKESVSVELDNEIQKQVNEFVTQELHELDEVIKETSGDLKKETELAHQINDQLRTQVDEVTHATEGLTMQGKEVLEVFHQVIEALPVFEQELEQAEKNLVELSSSAKDFGEVVEEAQKEQKSYAKAVTQLGVFVEEVTQKTSLKKAHIEAEQLLHTNKMQGYVEEEKIFDEDLSAKRVRLTCQNKALHDVDVRLNERDQSIKIFDTFLNNLCDKEQLRNEKPQTPMRAVQEHNDVASLFEAVLIELAIKTHEKKNTLTALDEYINKCVQERQKSEEVLNELISQQDLEDEAYRLQGEHIQRWTKRLLEPVQSETSVPLVTFDKDALVAQINARACAIKANEAFIQAEKNERLTACPSNRKTPDDEPCAPDSDVSVQVGDGLLAAVQARLKARTQYRVAIEDELSVARVKALTSVGFYSQPVNSRHECRDELQNRTRDLLLKH